MVLRNKARDYKLNECIGKLSMRNVVEAMISILVIFEDTFLRKIRKLIAKDANEKLILTNSFTLEVS